MKVMTYQERLETIDRLKKLIARADNGGVSQNMTLPASEIKAMAETALASLNSPPVGRVINGRTVAITGDVKKGDALYTSPPMPVFDLPDEFPEKTDSEYQMGKEEGWHDYKREMKSRNGVK